MKSTILYILLFSMINSFGQGSKVDSISLGKITTDKINPTANILLYVEHETTNFVFNKNYGEFTDSTNQNIQFRIASSTKLFVATIVMQLAEEEKIDLNDTICKYLSPIEFIDFDNFHLVDNTNYSNEITIVDLLSHRSGLADIFTDRLEEFMGIIFQNPKQQYSPKKIIELYYKLNLNESAHFKPNEGWNYSDMNYVLLGLLIETIDNKPLAMSIRERILTPLNMEYTYFEFYEEPKKTTLQINQFINDINFTDLNTSFDWSGGGLVSTNSDLTIFMKALFNLKLISQKSLDLMTDTKFTKIHENQYGLGIFKSYYNGKVFYGHYGFYGSYIGYCPENKTTLSYCISQAQPEFNVYQYINEVISLTDSNGSKIY